MDLAVGENDEISIKQVADAIVKAVGFEGEYSVRTIPPLSLHHLPYSSST
jgi:hypothetical protein